ncbi:hypothetical protein JIQ42_08244 [Leishmania sp. Namibia]|uniref:hypothetical protein n=1 Tax=Leishmania sp. Namibia TaxID=2802991 RepID=UPI001B711472|nr:hypothetical protein JIQ42_08244 [Leishmania sp. Namibia]
MQTSTVDSRQQQRQQSRRTNSTVRLSSEPMASPFLMVPPSAPQLDDGGCHPHPCQHHHPHRHRAHQQHRQPCAGAPAPPPYSDHSGAASVRESVSPLMHSPSVSLPLASPLERSQPYHSRYRSSLPAPPPLRSLPRSSDSTSRRLACAHAPRHPPQRQQQRHGHADPSARPTTAHRGPRAHHRRSSRSNVQQSPSAAILSNGQVEDEEAPSTPVDQRIPAMVPPSYDAYNLGAPGAGMGRPAAAVHGGYASSSLTSQGYHLKTVQPQPQSQILHTLKLVEGVWRAVAPPQQRPPPPQQQLQHRTATYPCHDKLAYHSPNSHRSDCDRSFRNTAGGAHAEDHSTGIRGEAAAAANAASPTRSRGAKSPAHTIPATTTVTATGTSCGLSLSIFGGDWQSPSLATANLWGHHQNHPQLHHSHTTPASLAMRSSSVSLSDGLDTALSPISTPVRAPPTPRQQQQRPHHRRDRHGAHYRHRPYSPLAPSLATEETYAMYGQCSTPREADQAARTPSAAAPGAATLVAGRGSQQALVTPTTLMARAPPATVQDAVAGTTATPARWAFADSAAAYTSVGRPSLRGGAVEAHHDADDGAALLHASSSAYLRYRRNADFLYAVDDADGCAAAAVPMASAVTAVGNAFMLAAAQAATVLDSPVAVSRSVSFCSPASSSVYCSPQLFRVGDVQQSAPETATTTPARTAGLRLYQPHGQHGSATVPPPPHVDNGSNARSYATVTPLWCSCCGVAGWAGADALRTPPSAPRRAAGIGEGWRSPMQWDPRQARDDLEMEAVKHVAEFALGQRAVKAAGAAAAVSATALSFLPPSPSYASAPFVTMAQAPLVAGSPSHARTANHAEGTYDDSVTLDAAALAGEEEEAAEWLELLLHYRDRENESGRIRRALAHAAATPQAAAAEAGGASNPSAAATAATSLSWWAASSLMRGRLPSRVDRSAQQQPQRQGWQQRHAQTRPAVSSPSIAEATGATLAPPPAQLCAAMSAHRAARTISWCVHRHVWRMRENERHRVSTSVAGRVTAR